MKFVSEQEVRGYKITRRGIRVCETLAPIVVRDFKNFIDDMGRVRGKTLDRIDHKDTTNQRTADGRH